MKITIDKNKKGYVVFVSSNGSVDLYNLHYAKSLRRATVIANQIAQDMELNKDVYVQSSDSYLTKIR